MPHGRGRSRHDWPEPDGGVARWQEEPEREIADARVLSVGVSRCAVPARPDATLEAVRIHCPDWVNVVALTSRREIVLVEQYRHGIARVTLEIPGGSVDAGETPEAACARELLEETGHAGDPVRILGACSPNPALQDNRVTTGLVTSARRVGPVAGDEFEDIVVRLVPLDEVPALVRAGLIHHALVLAALHWLSLDDALR